jgi:hypothetical protein
LNYIEIEKNDWSITYIDWNEIIRLLQDELWILSLEVNFNSLFKDWYNVIIQSKDDESIFYNWFNDDYLDDNYSKEKLKNNHYVLQDICNWNWFSIKDLFIYNKGDEKTKKYWISKKLYDNNPVFRWLYKEYNNYLWYMDWSITNIVKLDIDEILSFYVKWYEFNFGNWWLTGINDSIYELKLNPVKIKASNLDLFFYKRSTIEKTYDFCTRYFE